MLKDKNEYLNGIVYEIIGIIGEYEGSPEQRGVVLFPCEEEFDLSGLSFIKSRGTYLLIVDIYEQTDDDIFGIFIPEDSHVNLVLEEIKKDFGELSEFVEDVSLDCLNLYLFEQLAEDPNSCPKLTPSAMAFLNQHEAVPSFNSHGERDLTYIYEN